MSMQWFSSHTAAKSLRPQGFGLADYATALLAALLAMAVYLYTVAPTVTGEDSGELIAAAYTLGIPHPSGYPIWCLLGKLFIEVLPWGTVAWRVNVMSSFFGALTVGLVTLLGIRIVGRRGFAAAGALAFAFSHEFWEQGLIAEVYTLNAFFIALCLLLLAVWYERRRNGYLYALALVYGLSLTNHGTMMAVGPMLLFFIVIAERPQWRHLRRYAGMAVLAAVGLLVYLYLPLRSRINPAMDWGNPETWRSFWAHVNREQYAFLFDQEPRSPEKLLRQIGLFVSLFTHEFTLWVVWLAIPGAVVLVRRSLWHGLLILTLFTGIALAFMIIPNYPIDQENIWVVNVFWIPCYMMAGLLVGAGVAGLADRFESRALAVILALVAVGLPLASNFYENNRRDYYLAEDFGRNVLRTLEPNAIYFPDSDHANFPVVYLHVVEGERPDVVLGKTYGYPPPDVYRGMPEDLKATIAKPSPTAEDVAMIERWVVDNTSRPVYFSTRQYFPSVPEKDVVPAGLLFRVVPAGQKDLSDYFSTYHWHSLKEEDVRKDFSGLWMLYDYHASRARAALQHGAFGQAMKEYDRALALLPNSKQAYNNAGTDLVSKGLFQKAIEYYKQALQIDPAYPLAMENLAMVYGYTNQHSKAVALYRRLVENNPRQASLHYGLGLSLLETGEVEEGLALLERAAETAPDNPRYAEDLGTALWVFRGDGAEALRWVDRALELKPRNRQAAALAHRIRDSINAATPASDEH